MPDAAPENKEPKKPVSPSLADKHWRATLRTRKRDDLDNDMVAAIETNNAWRFDMLMQLDAGWARNERIMKTAIEHGREAMLERMAAKEPGWEDGVRLDALASDAASAGQLRILKLLIETYKADFHHYSEEPLRNAVSKGHEDIVAYLVAKGADVKTWSNDPLRSAAEGGHLGIVKILVEAGAEINSGYYGGDVLGKAVESGNKDVVEYLIGKGADVAADHHHAFKIAAREGKSDIVQVFIDHKVDPKLDDSEAFVDAVSNKHFATADLLLANGASVNAQQGKALRNAAYSNDKETADYLFNHGADPNSRDGRSTALSEAVRGSQPEMVLFLMRRGATLEAQQGAAWEQAKQSNRKMLRTLVKGAREQRKQQRDDKRAEFDATFGKKAYTLDDLRNTKGPSGDTGLLIAAQTGKFGELVSRAKSGMLQGEDLFHPDDRIDTVLSMLIRHKDLQGFFHPPFWAGRAQGVKDVIEMMPERYQKRVNLGPIANEMNYRALKEKAAHSNRSLKPPKLGP